MPVVKADYRGNLSTFQIFNCSCSQLNYSCYRHSSIIGNLFVYLFFGLRKVSPRDSTKVKVEHAGFYSFDRKS